MIGDMDLGITRENRLAGGQRMRKIDDRRHGIPAIVQ
jgi:hypothetical protein